MQTKIFDSERHENEDSWKNEDVWFWNTNENKVWNEDTEKIHIRLVQKKGEFGKEHISIKAGKTAKGKEKTLLNKIHRKLVAQLKKMGMTEFKDRRGFLVTAPVIIGKHVQRSTKRISLEEPLSVRLTTQLTTFAKNSRRSCNQLVQLGDHT